MAQDNCSLRSDDLQQAVEQLDQLARATGAEQWDIVAGASQSDSLSLSKSKVDSVEFSSDRAIGVRLFRNGSPGYAFAERLQREVLEQLVKDAWDHTYLSAPLPIALPSRAPLAQIELQSFDPSAEELTISQMESFALELDRCVRLDNSVAQVTHLGVDRSLSTRLFLNSNGLSHSRCRSTVSAGVQVLAQRDGFSKTGYRSLTRRGTSALELELLAADSVERARSMLGASPVAGGEWPVILDRCISGQLFSLYGSAFFADQVQKGQSFLAGKMGTQIASPLLTLRDDPHQPHLMGARLLDGEGVATQPLTLVQNGELHHWLYNLESAGRHGVAPTGNGVRGSAGAAQTSYSNLVVDLGDCSVEEMRQRHPKMLLLNRLEGSSGCSAVSGEMSIGVQGFLIENGELIRPVDGITISGNWLQLLGSIEAVGTETADPFSSNQVPDLLLSSVRVSS